MVMMMWALSCCFGVSEGALLACVHAREGRGEGRMCLWMF